MTRQRVAKQNARQLLTQIAAKGRTFSTFCARRTDNYLRYLPTTQYGTGKLAYNGDCSDLRTRQFQSAGRGGRKVILEAAGAYRWQQFIKGTGNPSKHWKSKGGRLSFDPVAKNLFHAKGFYNDGPKNNGRVARHDAWRPWAFVCLNTIATTSFRDQNTSVVSHGSLLMVGMIPST